QFDGANVITTGAQTYNDKVVLSGNTLFQGTSLAFNGSPLAIDASTFDLTLISNSMAFNVGLANSVIGTGDVTIQPFQTSDNILINGVGGILANTLVINASDFGAFSGFGSM